MSSRFFARSISSHVLPSCGSSLHPTQLRRLQLGQGNTFAPLSKNMTQLQAGHCTFDRQAAMAESHRNFVALQLGQALLQLHVAVPLVELMGELLPQQLVLVAEGVKSVRKGVEATWRGRCWRRCT